MKTLFFLLNILATLFVGASTASASERLVVIDGSLTEIVYALGMGEKVIAVDTTSTYPENAANLPNVGYMRALAAEGILSLSPTMVIATESAGPPQVLEHLKKTGIGIHLVKNPYSIAGIYQKIDAVSDLLGAHARASELKQSIKMKLSPVLENIDKRSHFSPKILVFLGMQGNQLMAAGQGTQAEAVINILGGANAAGGFKGYKPMNKEAVLASGADAIIVLAHGSVAGSNLLSAFSYTQAAKNDQLIVAQSAELLGFGPRFPDALAAVSKRLYAK